MARWWSGSRGLALGLIGLLLPAGCGGEARRAGDARGAAGARRSLSCCPILKRG